jgi:hypothetical protein
MTPRTCRRLIVAGTAMTTWSVLILAGMHGGLWLSAVTR